ncbi:MAG TPA: hypothetical protein VFK44_14770 [Bacillales bacterium]|nr:hypothetical protein [Bacillales bacterium]
MGKDHLADRPPMQWLFKNESQSGYTVKKSGEGVETPIAIGTSHDLVQMVTEPSGDIWLAEKKQDGQEPSNVFVCDDHGEVVEKIPVPGQPNLHRYEDEILVECEGDGGTSTIYEYEAKTRRLLERHEVEGYSWKLAKDEERLYVCCYQADKDVSVLYSIGEGGRQTVDLGENSFPTDLLFHDGRLYVAMSPIVGTYGRKVMVFDTALDLVSEWKLPHAPRHLHTFNDEMIILAFDLDKDAKSKLIYVPFESQSQRTYALPQGDFTYGDGRYLYVFQLENERLHCWDHERKKMAETVRLEKPGDGGQLIDVCRAGELSL